MTTYPGSVAPAAGVVGLSHSNGLVGGAIRFGQRLRFPAEFCRWNHAFVMVDEEWLIEMGGHGARKRPLVDYNDTEHALVLPDQELDLDFARWALANHSRYGYATIGSLSLSLALGTSVEFGIKAQMICSGLVAACAPHVYEWKADPSHVTPAEVAMRWWQP